MTIDVVIPTLNEERSLPHTLAHTASLGFDHIIVVDGGSRDRTREVVTDLIVTETVRGSTFEVSNSSTSNLALREPQGPEPRRGEPRTSNSAGTSNLEPRTSSLALITSAPGRAQQMNAGAAAGRSDVLLFLHADTELPTDATHSIEQAFQDPTCVGGRFDVQFGHPSPLGSVISTLMNLRSRWSGIATGDQAIFVRRTIFEQLGGYAEIPLMEDIDFSRRLKRMGQTAPLRSRVVTSYRRWETHGPIRTILLMWALRFLYWTGVSPQRLQMFYTIVR